MTCSFAVAESYAVRARSRLASRVLICERTRCASACFAPIDGSPAAVPAATKAAATAISATGVCRFRNLMSDSPYALATGAPRGAGTSQVAEASNWIG